MNKIVSLNRNGQFRRLYNKGKSGVRPSLVLYAGRNGLSYNRLGITVGKKIGKAVSRNRAKRRLREVYRECFGSLKTGYDFVLVARCRTVTEVYQRLLGDFKEAAKEVGVYNDQKDI